MQEIVYKLVPDLQERKWSYMQFRRHICIYLYEPMKELRENPWENWGHFKTEDVQFTDISKTPCYQKCFPFYIAHVLQAREVEISGSSFESNIFQFFFQRICLTFTIHTWIRNVSLETLHF